jgi:hypothetical protein
MAGLVPAIYVFDLDGASSVAARHKPGHDDPYCGLRIFVAEDTPRRTVPGLDVI